MESPWKNISTAETTSLQDIMSEEFAKEVHEKKAKKDKLCEYVECSRPKEALVERERELSSDDCKADTLINQDILKKREHTKPPAIDCESEHKKRTRRRSFNKDANRIVELSFARYQSSSENSSLDLEDEDEDEDEDQTVDNKTNRKGFTDTQGDRLYEGCLVTSYSPDFTTDDASDLYRDLPTPVFNQLKAFSYASNKTKGNEHKDNSDSNEMIIDEHTRQRLNNLVSHNVLKQVNGVIAVGRNSMVVHAILNPHYAKKMQFPEECVVKVYKTTENEFHKPNSRKGLQNRKLLHQKAMNEMQMMQRMMRMKYICSPFPITLKDNMLVMSFVGYEGVPERTIKYTVLHADLEHAYEEICSEMKEMYRELGLVHGTLSERNILLWGMKCFLIDFSESVDARDPRADELLMRDCKNVCSFFAGARVKNVVSGEGLFEYIAGNRRMPFYKN